MKSLILIAICASALACDGPIVDPLPDPSQPSTSATTGTTQAEDPSTSTTGTTESPDNPSTSTTGTTEVPPDDPSTSSTGTGTTAG